MPMSHLDGLAAYITASPSSFHAAAEAARLLAAAGFVSVAETDRFPAEPGGYVLVRDGSVLAWRIPDRLAEPSFRIVGAHTDSPGFTLKPRPTSSQLGWQQAGMEVYGGPLPNAWLDREFGLAGRLVDGAGDATLVQTGPLLRIPQVAPHLDQRTLPPLLEAHPEQELRLLAQPPPLAEAAEGAPRLEGRRGRHERGPRLPRLEGHRRQPDPDDRLR